MAASFKAPDGKTYAMRLTHGAIRRAADATGIDLYALADTHTGLVEFVYERNHRLLPLIAALATPAVADVDAWADGIDGPTLEAATVALMEAWADFFRRHPISLQIQRGGAVAVLAAIEARMSGEPKADPVGSTG